MKIFNKLISLCLVLIVAISLVGCNGCNNGNNDGIDASVVEKADFGSDNFDIEYKYPNGIHEFYVKTLDSYIVENSVSEYVIVIPKNADKHDLLGLSEFNVFFGEATGLSLPVVTDDAVNFDNNSKFICIGKVNFLSLAGITDLTDLGLSGFVVKTQGKSIFITGKTYGTVYGVYEFLKWSVNYRYFVDDCYSINKNIKSLKLIEFNIKDVPDYQSRGKGYSNVSTPEMEMRMRYTYEDTLISVRKENGEGGVHHTVFSYIDPAVYATDHPEFYSEGKMQLSYTANGNPESVKIMQDIVFNKLTKMVTEYPDVAAVEFTQNDVNAWSSYDIEYYKPTYGSAAAAASQIIFINPVAKRLQAWIDENFPGREFRILLFAYVNTIEAPVKLVGNEYVPIDNNVVLEPNVGIYYAPIEADFIRPLDHELNSTLKTQSMKWSVLAKNLYLWLYSTNFSSYLLPYDTFDNTQELYQYLNEYNAMHIFDQGVYDGGRSSGWSMLKVYMDGQLMWNTHYNVQTIYDDFFDNFYGPASDEMFKIFNQFRMWSDITKNMEQPIGGASSCLTTAMFDRKYWPQEILQGWLDMYDVAYDKLSSLKDTDLKTYNVYRKRIALEHVSPKYMMLTFYKDNLSSRIHQEMLDSLVRDIDELSISYSAEHKEIGNLKETLSK